MYFVLEPHQHDSHPDLLKKMFLLRSRVFCDKLKWVETNGVEERDVYDDYMPVYLMATDETGEHLYGSARIMPTSGPTLLADVFGETVPDAMFDSPFVWEITRLCLDDELIRKHGKGSETINIVRSMLVASLEYGIQNGIETYLANFDDLRLRVWRRAGVGVDVIGTSHAFSTTVHLGIAEVTESAQSEMRKRLGHNNPVLSQPPVPFVPAQRVERMLHAA